MKHTAIIFSVSAKTIVLVVSRFLDLFNDRPKLFGVFKELGFMREGGLGITIRRPHVEFDVFFERIEDVNEFAGGFVEDAWSKETMLVKNLGGSKES